jgi:hypothetical protein
VEILDLGARKDKDDLRREDEKQQQYSKDDEASLAAISLSEVSLLPYDVRWLRCLVDFDLVTEYCVVITSAVVQLHSSQNSFFMLESDEGSTRRASILHLLWISQYFIELALDFVNFLPVFFLDGSASETKIL